jgi:hypothetical protein
LDLAYGLFCQRKVIVKVKKEPFKMKEVKSTNISEIGYLPDKKVLRVKFKNGGIYEYSDVSEKDHDEFWKADSIGQYFHQHIRGKSFKKV